ncbi:MAG TPA: response regulator [Pirellulales bacterium]|nr:response regulator [Pirellulales bacterium]
MAKRILLCDDDVTITSAARYKLAQAGYDVQCASDGLAGWEAIQACSPDLLITDCQMPRLNGLQLIARIREVPLLAELPIFLLTGKGFELPHDELKQRFNLRAVLDKPFSPRELLKLVNQALAHEPVAPSP